MEDEVSTLEDRIEDLRRELYQTKEIRDGLNLEARKWAEQRNRINRSFKELISKITELRAKRRAVNERFTASRTSLVEAKERYREKKVQVRNLSKKLRDFRAKGSYMSSRELEDRIQKIDWRIQTTTLPLDEEKSLIEQVKVLESQLAVHKQIRKLKDEMGSLEEEMDKLHDEISERFEEKNRLREDLLNLSEKASELKAEADEMHKKFLDCKDEARKVHLTYVETLNRIRTLQQELAKIEEKKKAKRESELKSDLEKTALEKLKSRKKLTLEEFKILAEKGRI